MSFLYNMPWTQVFDGAGNTLAGAKLYFYEAGTSILKNVYADTNLSVALSNPVVADGGGRFAPIYLSAGKYKVALYTAENVLIWTADNVESQSVQEDIETALSAIRQTSLSAGYDAEEAQNPDNFPKAVYKYANAANFYTDSGNEDNVYILQGQDNYERPNDYFAGQEVNFVTQRANTSSNISVNVAGLGAKSVFRFDGSEIGAGDFFGMIRLIYNGSFFVFSEDADNVENKLNIILTGKADVDLSNMNPTPTVKEEVVGWGLPDWSAGVAVTLTTSQSYTATMKCLLYVRGYIESDYFWIRVNGVQVANLGGSYNCSDSIYIPLDVGDVVTKSSWYSGETKIFPYKGVNTNA